MTTKTLTTVPFITASANNGTAGSTKGTPSVSSGWINISAYDGGDMIMSVLNGSTPTASGILTIQASTDNGTTVSDFWTFSGDLNAYNSSTQAGLISAVMWIDPGLPYLRVIGYGNTGNPVTFSATFSGITRA